MVGGVMRPDYTTLCDDALVTIARAGDQGAFEELVKRHRDSVASRLRRQGVSDADLEDAVQEALVSALQQLRRLRDPKRVVSWLHTIARNKLRDGLRRRPTTAGDEELQSQLDARRPFTQVLDSVDLAAAIRADPRLGRGAHRLLKALFENDFDRAAASKELGIHRAALDQQFHRWVRTRVFALYSRSA